MKAKIEIQPARPDEARAIALVLAESFAKYEPLYTAEAFAATTPNSDVIETRFAEGPIGHSARSAWGWNRGTAIDRD